MFCVALKATESVSDNVCVFFLKKRAARAKIKNISKHLSLFVLYKNSARTIFMGIFLDLGENQNKPVKIFRVKNKPVKKNGQGKQEKIWYLPHQGVQKLSEVCVFARVSR